MNKASLNFTTTHRAPTLLFAAAVVLSPAAAAVPTPLPPLLQPTSKWNVDYGDAHCIAMRDYGTPQAPLLLAFKPSPIGDVMQVSIVRPGGKNTVNQYPGAMTVGDAPQVPISVLGFAAKSGKKRVSSVNLPLALYRPLRGAASVRLQSAGEMDYRFALSNLDAVARTLDDCVASLRKLWNIGAESRAIAQPAASKKPLHTLFSTYDYPRVALSAQASGLVELMTLIDETGKVASCMVIGSSGLASLDAQSCAVITARAHYTPAISVAGKPARSGAIQRIRWMLPD